MNERERRGLNSNSRNRKKGPIAQYEEYMSGGGGQTDESVLQYTSRSYEELRAIDEEKLYKEDEGWTFITEEEYQAQQLAQNSLASVPDAGWGEIAKSENVSEEKTEAEREIANEVLAGALQGDFNDDPTFWSDVGQIVTGLIPIAGQLGDARDLIHALDDITNKEGYKKIGSWAALVLIVIGFVPGVGDAIKSVGKRGIRYLDNNRITKRIGQFLGDNIISPILERVGDLTAPIVNQIKDAIRRKLAEAQEIAQQLGEGVDNVIDDVTGRPQLATEGAGNVPTRIETEPPVRGNEPSRMEGNPGGGINPELQNRLNERVQPSVRNNLLNNGEALRVVRLHGDDAIELIALYGDNAVNALPNLAKMLPSDRLGSLLEKINSGQITGDLSETLGRVADGGTNTIGAVGELDGFLRATERGYDKVESIKPPNSTRAQGQKGELSPEASLFKGSQEFHLEQKTATEPPKYNNWKKQFDKANKQVKADGFTGDIQFNFTNVDISKGELNNQNQIESLIKDRMQPNRARSINYFEILWKDTDGKIMKTYRTRNADGTVSEVITEQL